MLTFNNGFFRDVKSSSVKIRIVFGLKLCFFDFPFTYVNFILGLIIDNSKFIVCIGRYTVIFVDFFSSYAYSVNYNVFFLIVIYFGGIRWCFFSIIIRIFWFLFFFIGIYVRIVWCNILSVAVRIFCVLLFVIDIYVRIVWCGIFSSVIWIFRVLCDSRNFFIFLIVVFLFVRIL